MDETKAGQEAVATPPAPQTESFRLRAAKAFADASREAGLLASAIGQRGLPTLDRDHSRNLLMAHAVRARWIDLERAYNDALDLLQDALLEDFAPAPKQPARPAPPTPDGSASMAGKEK